MCWSTRNKYACGHVYPASSNVQQCESNHKGLPCTAEEQTPSYRSFYRNCKNCTATTPLETPAVDAFTGRREYPFPSFDPSSYSKKHVSIINDHFVSNNNNEKAKDETSINAQKTLVGKEGAENIKNALRIKTDMARKESDKWFEQRTPYKSGMNAEEFHEWCCKRCPYFFGPAKDEDEELTEAYLVGDDLPNGY